MTWVGVGNVQGVLVREDPYTFPRYESLLLRGGVVGARLPPLRASILTIARGDLLVLCTDGIQSGFIEGVRPKDAAQRTADRILARYAKDTDDALVLAARYLGAPR